MSLKVNCISRILGDSPTAEQIAEIVDWKKVRDACIVQDFDEALKTQKYTNCRIFDDLAFKYDLGWWSVKKIVNKSRKG